MSMEALLSAGMILQVAFALFTDRQRREMLQTSAPVTACLLVLYGLAAAAWPHTSSVQRYHDAAPRGDGGAAAGGYGTRRSRTSARARILRI